MTTTLKSPRQSLSEKRRSFYGIPPLFRYRISVSWFGGIRIYQIEP
jgi:hypothetical protein